MAGGACSLDAMAVYEATKAVFARVHGLDPDNASKIMGMLLIRDDGEKELIRLAFGPEHLLHAFVAAARAELAAKPPSPPSPALGPLQARAPWGLPSPGGPDQEQQAPPFAGDQAGYDAGEALYPEDYDCWSPASGAHRRSLSLSDAEAAAWRPCLYYARGFCKNGASCRFLHGLPEDDPAAAAEREMVVMRAKALAAARAPQFAPSSFPFSPSPKGLGFLLQQQQQSDPQRAAAAAAMLLGGDDMHRFSVRSPRMVDRGDLMTNPAARQIYLTFPADSTFSEEDVSNYFSMFGPVQDVRIPYQQKRMFGFVTFVYPETVKIILSKGNPHFVCDARVLVKPYKEKGKVPDKYRKLQNPQHGEFAACTTPTGLLDSRDPFDLQQPQIGPRVMYGNNANHEAFLRRRLEEQQHAAELQQAIELQGRRFMGLQLLDLKSRGHHLGSPVGPPMLLGQTDGMDSLNGNGNALHLEDVALIQDSKLNSSHAMSAPASSGISAIAAEGKHEDQQEEDADGTPKQAVNPGEEEKRESGPGAAAPKVACGFQESGVEHNLPDSPFASPTKAAIHTAATAQNGDIYNTSPHHLASSLFPPTSSLELPPYNSCFFQVPRFSSGHVKPLGCEYSKEVSFPLSWEDS